MSCKTYKHVNKYIYQISVLEANFEGLKVNKTRITQTCTIHNMNIHGWEGRLLNVVKLLQWVSVLHA